MEKVENERAMPSSFLYHLFVLVACPLWFGDSDDHDIVLGFVVWGKRSDLWHEGGVKAGMGGLSKLGWWLGGCGLGGKEIRERETERIWVFF
ncbi:unnamed protein product [Prunus armeniaca]|uniref:Uncharacterized protein n=1 Tax=Prunus armeniaca TaxID=36596 RepID=A0A6J5WGZ5_PRUAR|nr:unnamed protein product [Prunus armeniaca]